MGRVRVRMTATVLTLGASAGLLIAATTCTDRTRSVQAQSGPDRDHVCEEFCAADEVCFPGVGDDYVNAHDFSGCLEVCKSKKDWTHPECAETITAEYQCLASLTCEHWYAHRTDAEVNRRTCEEETLARSNCRVANLDFSDDD